MHALRSIALVLTALACRPSAPADTSADARRFIDSANQHWAQLTAAGRADSLAVFFHEAAVLYPPNMAPVRGRESIRAFFGVLNTMSSPAPTLTVRSDSVWASGDLAVELGRWDFAWPSGSRRPPGAAAVDSGTYMIRWVREGDRWLMVEDIWNSASPMGQPAP